MSEVKCQVNFSNNCIGTLIYDEDVHYLYGYHICRECAQHMRRTKTLTFSHQFAFSSNLFSEIDISHKAYILGWMASNSCDISVDSLTIKGTEYSLIEKIRDLIYKGFQIKNHGNLFYFTISKPNFIENIVKHLGIEYDSIPLGNKSFTVKMPEFESDILTLAFIRGYFDASGEIFDSPPSCSIYSDSANILLGIEKFVETPAIIEKNRIYWSGVNAIDFMYRLYENCDLYSRENYDRLVRVSNQTDTLPLLRYRKVLPGAVDLYKKRMTDSGYDLTVIKKHKEENGVYYYDTGIQIQPEYGYYCEIVARSSLAKSGWMIANNVGIIDAGYTGNLLIALVRVVNKVKEIELPARIAQLIPRKLILMNPVEVSSLETTERVDTGGLGSKQFSN